MFRAQARAGIRRDMLWFTVFVLAVFGIVLGIDLLRHGLPLWPAVVDAVQVTAIAAMLPALLVLLRFARLQRGRG